MEFSKAIRVAAVAEKHNASASGVDVAVRELAEHFGITLEEALDVMENMDVQPVWPDEDRA